MLYDGLNGCVYKVDFFPSLAFLRSSSFVWILGILLFSSFFLLLLRIQSSASILSVTVISTCSSSSIRSRERDLALAMSLILLFLCVDLVEEMQSC